MNIDPRFFGFSIILFILLIVLLLTFIFIFTYLKIKRDRKFYKWKQMADLLLRNAIFFDEENVSAKNIPVTPRTEKLLKTIHFRRVLTTQLVNARKNVSGSSADNLKRLYLQLKLDKYALSKLSSHKWHIKAQAIQELSIIGLDENAKKIYRFINYTNELVRMEAQIAIVKFYGFKGLRFLNLVTYPITEWQQIRLLHELSHVSTENFSGIEKWLKSENTTVVIFALKLARNYHRFELYNTIIKCLEHPDRDVRLQAINTLGEIYNNETSAILIERYLKEGHKQQLAIIKVLQSISTDDDIPVLFDLLDNTNLELKAMAAHALAKIGAKGFYILQQHDQAKQYPLNEIIAQIKSEFAL